MAETDDRFPAENQCTWGNTPYVHSRINNLQCLFGQIMKCIYGILCVHNIIWFGSNIRGATYGTFLSFSDPYCVVSLLPKDKYKLQTKIKKRTLNPRWNESFLFEGNVSCLKSNKNVSNKKADTAFNKRMADTTRIALSLSHSKKG